MEKKTMFIAIGIVAILIVAGIAAIVLTQNNDGDDTEKVTIKQKGSDTMLELCQIWSEEFGTNYTNINVEVSGGGSGTGITALIAQEVQIAQSSRAMKQTEKDAAVAAGVNPVEFKVAVDGISIIVHNSNTLTNLTMDQLRGLYNGTISNWNQVGGPDLAVTLYGRQSSSGTYAYFQEVVLKAENYSIDMQMLQGNSAIVSAVAGDESGIGYVGIGYVSGATSVNVLDLRTNATTPVYSPLDENSVLTGKYPLSRYLYFYTAGVPTGAMLDYVMWIVDPAKGQNVAEEIGFYAIPQNVYEDDLVALGANPAAVTLKQKGSDTMLELCQIWSEEFHADYDWVTVEISGGGSGTGITAFIAKQVDMAQASRAMKQTEIDAAIAAGISPVEFKVAIDGVALITHSSNSVDNLTLDQLRGLYNGTISNWNQVGGPDLAVTLYGRQSSSGTYAYFQEVVLKAENYSIDMQMLQGNSAIVSAVAGDEGGIGYVGIGYASGASGINIVELKKDDTSTPFSPLDSNAIYSGDYALSRYLFIYTDGTPMDAQKRWLDWILSADDGQAEAVAMGFYALPADILAQERSKLGV